MREFGKLNLLRPQLFSEGEERRTIENTMTLDYFFGHRDVIQNFALKFEECKPWAKSHLQALESLTKGELEIEVKRVKSKSLLMTLIMFTGECNANCEVCYTSREKGLDELQGSEIKDIINQTKKLGSRVVYVAGEGEPTLDKSLFDVIDYTAELGMDFLMFTNGLLLSNDTLCKKRLGIGSDELIEKLKNKPVYIYHKLWSTNPEKVRKLMQLNPCADYKYSEFRLEGGRDILIPRGLDRLLKKFPRERVGIETCVENRTADEIKGVVIPFIEQTKVKSYGEPLIHSGGNFNVHQYDPTQEQLKELQPWLVRQGCTRVAYMFAVHNNGYATPGISILPEHLRTAEDYEKLNIRKKDRNIKNLFELRHTHPFLVKIRYRISGCLCEEFNLEAAKEGGL